MNQVNINSIRDLIFGANDGLAISMILTAGLSSSFILESHFYLASLIILLWGSLITSLSVFSAGNSNLKDYKRKLALLKDDQSLKAEIRSTQNFIRELGLGKGLQIIAAKELEEEREILLNDPNISLPITTSPAKMAILYFAGFVIAALIPVLCFWLYFYNDEKTLVALVIVTPCLLILNFLKGHFTGINKTFSALSYTIITILATFSIYKLCGILS